MFEYCDKLIEELDDELLRSRSQFHKDPVHQKFDNISSFQNSSFNPSYHEDVLFDGQHSHQPPNRNMKIDMSDETKRLKIKKNFKKSKQNEVEELEPEHKDMMKTKPCNRGAKTPMRLNRQEFLANESEPTQNTTSKTERGVKALNLNTQSLVDILAGCKTEINTLRAKNALLESQNRELLDKVF